MEQLVVSEDVFAYLKPTIVVMKYFGLAPIVYSYNKGFYTLVKSTKYLLYSYTIAIALGEKMLLLCRRIWSSKLLLF